MALRQTAYDNISTAANNDRIRAYEEFRKAVSRVERVLTGSVQMMANSLEEAQDVLKTRLTNIDLEYYHRMDLAMQAKYSDEVGAE